MKAMVKIKKKPTYIQSQRCANNGEMIKRDKAIEVITYKSTHFSSVPSKKRQLQLLKPKKNTLQMSFCV